MELIPILSTIILVATISTFILAVGAYILYKIREGKQQNGHVERPAEQKAEYIVPKEEPVRKIYIEDVVDRKPVTETSEEKFKPVQEQSVVRNRSEKFEKEVIIADKVEIPKEKFVSVDTLNNNGTRDKSNSGEIKWR